MSTQAPAPPSPAPGGPAPAGDVPLFYRRGFRRLLQQGLYVAATALLFWYIYDALNLREFGFGFLNDPAAFKVANQWLIDVDGVTSSRIEMYLVGVWASLRVVFVAILLSTVVGIVVGVSRLSSNWLVARMAMLYVEVFRNTPLLVQVVLVYAIFLVGAPIIQEVLNIGDFAFLSNRGLAIPWPVPDAGWWGAARLVRRRLGRAADRHRRGGHDRPPSTPGARARDRSTALRQPLGLRHLRRRRAGHVHRAGPAGQHRPPLRRGHPLPRRHGHPPRVRRS